MSGEAVIGPAHQPGLVWGYDFVDGGLRTVAEADLLRPETRPAGFRWLHFSLADQRTRRWLEAFSPLPPGVRELLLSPEDRQRYVIEGEVFACLLNDIELEFHDSDRTIGVLRLAAAPDVIVTARRHPIRCAEVAKHRILSGARAGSAADALEIVFAALGEVQRLTVTELDDQVQAMEDDLLRRRPAPDAGAFLSLRSIMVRLHRAFSGMRVLFNRLEDDAALPAPLRAPIVAFAQRTAAIDAELIAAQAQLRLLRDELDLQATQRTNQNLYVLSILSVLLLPATLITGLFGMNTGGFPWAQDRHGTGYATLLAVGASLGVYVALRLFGFLRR